MRNLRYCGPLRFSGPRTVLCPTCGVRRGEPCRSTDGNRVGRAVSYTHRARRIRWNKTPRRRAELGRVRV